MACRGCKRRRERMQRAWAAAKERFAGKGKAKAQQQPAGERPRGTKIVRIR